MGTNEVPERIYINPNPEHRTWLIGKGDISFIEYVKEDAFIEKALKWIIENYHDYDHRDEFDVKGLVLDFKEYMKGE